MTFLGMNPQGKLLEPHLSTSDPLQNQVSILPWRRTGVGGIFVTFGLFGLPPSTRQCPHETRTTFLRLGCDGWDQQEVTALPHEFSAFKTPDLEYP